MPSLRQTLLSVAAASIGALPQQARSQDSATVVPGAHYEAGALQRFILGSGWRDLWVTPVKAPLFRLDTFAGGLKIDKQGGGFQTVTLHLSQKDGWQEYRFRSVDKYPEINLPSALKGTLAGRVIEDQTGNLFPGAGLIVPPFVNAVGGLNVPATLYVMPNDPALGEYRKQFAGMLGTVELKGEDGPDDAPGFAGSKKIIDSFEFFEEFVKSQGNRIDEREFLATRLVDFLINDTDRTPDNIDWARFGEEGSYLWRPILRDRDRAFTNGTGLLNSLFIQRVYPKFTGFDSNIHMRGVMASSYVFDRRFLQRLTARDFTDVARRVQAAVTDSVIESSIAAMPPEWRARTKTVDYIRETLHARRARLVDAAAKFYEELATDPDIYLTDDDERADIVRHANGQVTVTVARKFAPPKIVADVPNAAGGATRVMAGEVDSPSPAFYQRTFLPAETEEIRVFLGKGNDTAVVRGASNDSIRIRVIGGEGNDILADSVSDGAEFFYDAEGNNQFVRRGTHVSERPWRAPVDVFGFTLDGAWRPDWGQRRSWAPVLTYGEGAGLIVGAGPRVTSYGFRRLPYKWQAGAALLVGTGNGKLGVVTNADYRTENSPLGFTLNARASQLESFRFYGFGNDTPNLGRELSLAEQTIVSAEPSVMWHVGWRRRERTGAVLHNYGDQERDSTSGRRAVVGELQAGPRFLWTDPQPVAGSPLAAVSDSRSFAHVGVGVGVDLDGTDQDPVPMNGWRLTGSATGYPLAFGRGGFSSSSGMASAYLPLGLRGSSVALRVGGSMATGDFPPQFAAFIGGSNTVRGFAWQRFAGDRAASASTELRVPVGKLNFIVRSDVGVIALADAGRVWFDGQSAGGWHAGVGGGLWFAALGHAVSATYAHGDENRFYLKTGLPF